MAGMDRSLQSPHAARLQRGHVIVGAEESRHGGCNAEGDECKHCRGPALPSVPQEVEAHNARNGAEVADDLYTADDHVECAEISNPQ